MEKKRKKKEIRYELIKPMHLYIPLVGLVGQMSTRTVPQPEILRMLNVMSKKCDDTMTSYMHMHNKI